MAAALYGKCRLCGCTDEAIGDSGSCENRRRCRQRQVTCWICHDFPGQNLRKSKEGKPQCGSAEACLKRYAASVKLAPCSNCHTYSWQGGNAEIALLNGNARQIIKDGKVEVQCCQGDERVAVIASARAEIARVEARAAEEAAASEIPVRRGLQVHRLNSSKQGKGFARNISESEFQDWVIGKAQAAEWKWYHTVIPKYSRGGYPDLHLLRGKHSVFVELKTAAGILTGQQQGWLEDLHQAGHKAAVWRPGLKDAIEAFLGDPDGYISRHGGLPYDVHKPETQSLGCIECGKPTRQKADGSYWTICQKCK